MWHQANFTELEKMLILTELRSSGGGFGRHCTEATDHFTRTGAIAVGGDGTWRRAMRLMATGKPGKLLEMVQMWTSMGRGFLSGLRHRPLQVCQSSVISSKSGRYGNVREASGSKQD